MIEYAAPGPDDLRALAKLMTRAFDPAFGEAWSAEQVKATLARDGGLAQVARVDGGVAGLLLLRCAADEAELLLVAVDPDWRRRGIAARLLALAFDAARARGVGAVFLEVRESNAAARALYTGRGFADVGRRPSYYAGSQDRRYDAITMRRDLSA